ncbi:unnamed protein product [Enterobius vermicularis]|uniref:Uncharacterized protein n=1 Tax=Enterobius vermicularis TaxID=51028 RepID=A0A0N4V2K0_ENTVE|nr:unnamed protein product [Enterobius vermicularis]
MIKIQLPPGSKPWYELVDPMMTHNKLIELTEEFSQIYRTYGEQLSIRRYVRSSNQQGQKRTHSMSQSQAPSSLASLPPPPPAPMLNSTTSSKSEAKNEPARKIDISDYKQRTVGGLNNLNSSQQTSQRRNFMQPEMTQVGDLPLPPALVKTTEKKQPSVNDQDSLQSQKRRYENIERDPVKHRRMEVQEREMKHRRSEMIEKDPFKHRRVEGYNYGSKNVVGNSNSFSSSYSSQQHRVSSRGVEGSHRSGNPHLLNPDSRSSIRTSSPANSNTSSNQKQHLSSRGKVRDVNITASIPLPPNEVPSEVSPNAGNSNSNSTFAYMKRPQRPISPPPPPSTNRNYSSRMVLPPPPVPPANDELEDGEVL